MFLKLLNHCSPFQKSFALLLLTIPLCMPDAFALRGRRDDDVHSRSSLRRTRPVLARDIGRTADIRSSILRKRAVLAPISTADSVVPRRAIRIAPRPPMRIVLNRPTVVAHRRVCVRPAAPPVVVVTPPSAPVIVTRKQYRQRSIVRTQSEPSLIYCTPSISSESPFATRPVAISTLPVWPTSPIPVNHTLTKNPDPWPISPFRMRATRLGRSMMARRY